MKTGLDLPREPENQFDFLVMLGFLRWFDAPFIVGIILSPLAIFVIYKVWPESLTNTLLSGILFYLMWMCILIFRCMHFVIKSIGETKNVGFEAARMAATYLSGGKP
jgi:hypothetical protein